MIDFETRRNIQSLIDGARGFYRDHRASLRELSICMAIPAAAVITVTMVLPEPVPPPPAGEQLSGQLMPTSEPERVWTWPLAEEDAPAVEETSDEDQAPRRRRRHGRRG